MMASTFCDPCRYREINRAAIKYCHSCRESFCKGCAEVHKSSKATRTHFLIDASDSFVSSKFNKELESVQTCSYHENRSLDFYCVDHKAFLCIMCLLYSDDHKTCKTVDITIAGEKLLDNEFSDKVREEMQHVKSHADQAVESVRNALSKSAKSKDNMTEQLNMFVDSLQNLVDVVKTQVSQLVETTTDQFKDHEKRCLGTINKLENLKDTAESCDKLCVMFTDTGSSADVFRSAFVMKEQCKQFIDDVDTIKDDASVIKVVVEKSDFVERLENCNKPLFKCKTSRVDVHIQPLVVRVNLANAIEHSVNRATDVCASSKSETEMPTGDNEVEIRIEEPETSHAHVTDEIAESVAVSSTLMSSDVYESETLHRTEPLHNVNESPETTQQEGVPVNNTTHVRQENKIKRTIQMTHIRSFDISSSGQLAPPKIVGVLCLFDGRLVLSDSQNARLIILNDSGAICNEVFTPFMPKCLTNISKARFAVSILKDNRIALVKIKGISNKGISYIKTRYHTKVIRGISSDKLLVNMTDRDDNWYMDIIHVNGTYLQTINVNDFYDGYYIAIQHLSDRDKFNIIYGSDLLKNLKCCDETGKFVAKYNVSDITSVITDSYGYVYIICMKGEIVVLTPDFKLFKKERLTYLLKPSCSAFDSTNNKLYITTYQSSKIQVLDIARTFHIAE